MRSVQFVDNTTQANQEDIDKILPFLPQSVEEGQELRKQGKLKDLGVPRAVAAPLLNKLKTFHDAADAIYRKHAPVLDNAHTLLAHETDLRFGTLEKIAEKLLGPGKEYATPVALYAVRRALISSNFGFSKDQWTHRTTRVMTIQPKRKVRNIKEAAQWIREYQDDTAQKSLIELSGVHRFRPMSPGATKVSAFLEKAMVLIKKSRMTREPRGSFIGPDKTGKDHTAPYGSMKFVKSLPFNEADKTLIEFVKSDCLTQDFGPSPEHQSLISMLIRATSLYDGLKVIEEDGVSQITRAVQYLFLQEIGTILPFENRHLYDPNLLLPGHGHSKPLERLKNSINVEGGDEALPDSMADLRRDWKDLPVYCVDGHSAMNIDDGISIESIPNTDREAWIRVHVANPTARIKRDDEMARMAAHMTTNFYAPDTHHWMLPLWASQRHFSIAPDRAVLTFSARVDQNGHILQTAIQPGIVRNIIKITPSALCLLLDGVAEPTQTRHRVGLPSGIILEPPIEPVVPKLTVKQLDDLKHLYAIARARASWRLEDVVHLRELRPSVSIDFSYGMEGNAKNISEISLPPTAAHTVKGDPVITLSTAPFNQNQPQASQMKASQIVMEMMILASEAAANWCAERNVPILNRVTKRSDHNLAVYRAQSAGTFYREYVKPEIAENGHTRIHWALAVRLKDGVPMTSVNPGPLKLIGVPNYAKVTTPIGRYSDLINHWQIESALREEARIGKSLVGSHDDQYLVFKKADLAQVIPRLRAREAVMKRFSVASHHFWTSLFFYRAEAYSETDLPETFTIFLTQSLTATGTPDAFKAIIRELGVEVIVKIPPENMVTKGSPPESWGRPGDIWEAKWRKTEPYLSNSTWELARLLHRDEYSIEELLAKVGS